MCLILYRSLWRKWKAEDYYPGSRRFLAYGENGSGLWCECPSKVTYVLNEEREYVEHDVTSMACPVNPFLLFFGLHDLDEFFVRSCMGISQCFEKEVMWSQIAEGMFCLHYVCYTCFIMFSVCSGIEIWR